MKIINLKSLRIWTIAVASLKTLPAFAFNYHELEVYPWQTEGPGVWEFENYYMISSGDERHFDNHVLRNTLEINTGITDWLEVALYNDFAKSPNDDSWKYGATRLRSHMSFYEKGELPVDLGAYFEVGLPQEGDVDLELEGKLIIEKDVNRLTFALNPIIEFEHENKEEIKEDGRTEKEQEWELETAYSAAVSWRLSPSFLPKLSVFDDLKKPDERVAILYPSVEYAFSRNFKMGVGLGFGLTDAAEKYLINTKIELEI